MKHNDLISIIVPVYNVEKFLPQCIESIINQTYKNLEIILVDDGSTDSSFKICNEYANKDSRIKVIQKTNGGLSDARNKGMEICTGDYIGFVDSDDYIGKEMYEILYNDIKKYNADISICEFKACFDDSINFDINLNSIVYNNLMALQNLLLDKQLTSHAWNKLYKKDLFKNIKYPIGKIYEDIGTTYLLFEYSKIISYNKSIQYAYRQRKDSLCNSVSEKKINDYVEIINNRYEYLNAKYPNMKKILDASRIQSSLIFNFIIARDKNEKLYNSKLLIDDYKKNVKIDFNLFGKIKLKYIFALIVLKLNRKLFYKIFSK